MKSINIYDIEAERLEQLADINDMSTAELVELIMDYADDILEEYGYKTN
jgi:hypothetical protein